FPVYKKFDAVVITIDFKGEFKVIKKFVVVKIILSRYLVSLLLSILILNICKYFFTESYKR
ncbi:MAG: hypothetical protein KAH68_09555, partial [Draconibacterium sp.]|nr:hypothetical protein [Draconibacterium sp.]